jgi:hypothetical protein
LGQAVTPDFFRLFNEHPVAGRFLTPQDDESVAVLSYRLWQAEFGGDPSAIGRTLMLDGRPFRIAGVAPSASVFPPRRSFGPRSCSRPAWANAATT